MLSTSRLRNGKVKAIIFPGTMAKIRAGGKVLFLNQYYKQLLNQVV